MHGMYNVKKAIPKSQKQALADYPALLQRLLFHRGIKIADDARVFLNPDYNTEVHDPFLLSGMKRAVDRIVKAITNNERTVIYSDFDADGIPGAVILHDCFRKIGFGNFKNYIPHRNNEGFGLNEKAIEQFVDEGVKLIITIDCGIGDTRHVARANEYGMDVIITDHHLPNSSLPDAYVIVNPNQEDDTYPNKHLCGAAVVYKLVQALLYTIRNSELKIKDSVSHIPEGYEKWWLDMVGIATLSDMVSLTGENRTLAHYGLTVLRKSPRIGLRELLRKVNVSQGNLTEDDIVFMITPRINAASRMDVPEEAFNLLTTSDETDAQALVTHLHSVNNERKGVVAAMVKEIRKRIATLDESMDVIVMGNPLWKPGLLGLAAHKVTETYERPTFLWGRGNSPVLRGSCRSDGSVNLVELMEDAQDTFLEYGGHEHSGGFSVSHEDVHLLEPALNDSYKKVRRATSEHKTLEVDARLDLDVVTWETYETIKKLAPFGVGNPKPLFLFENIEVAEAERFGKEKNHARLTFWNSRSESISAIQFFVQGGGSVEGLCKGDKIDLIATIEKSVFRYQPELRLRIVDVHSL